MQAFTTCKSEIRRGENTSLELSGSQAASKTDCLSSHLVPALNSSDFIAYRFWRHGAAPSEIRVTVASNSALWQVCCESTNQSIDRSNLVVIMLLYRSAYCPAWSDLFYQSSLALSLMSVAQQIYIAMRFRSRIKSCSNYSLALVFDYNTIVRIII